MKKILVICGPTASGKSTLALKLASNQNAVIVNADSMQLYQDIQIISAAPSEADKKIVPHYLYGILHAKEHYSVADYVKTASKTISDICNSNTIPIIVGGTGMYINSLIFGFSPIPDIELELRQEARNMLLTLGNEEFFKELVKLDPESESKLNIGDSQRILRAYEVIKQSGKPISYFHNKPPIIPLPGYEFNIIMLNPERKFLYQTCNERFYQLIKNGALEEVKALSLQNLSQSMSIFKALGVRELTEYIKGRLSLDEAITLAQAKTRQYAKRQVTWFTHQIKNKITLNYSTKEEFNKILKHATIEQYLAIE